MHKTYVVRPSRAAAMHVMWDPTPCTHVATPKWRPICRQQKSDEVTTQAKSAVHGKEGAESIDEGRQIPGDTWMWERVSMNSWTCKLLEQQLRAHLADDPAHMAFPAAGPSFLHNNDGKAHQQPLATRNAYLAVPGYFRCSSELDAQGCSCRPQQKGPLHIGHLGCHRRQAEGCRGPACRAACARGACAAAAASALGLAWEEAARAVAVHTAAGAGRALPDCPPLAAHLVHRQMCSLQLCWVPQ